MSFCVDSEEDFLEIQKELRPEHVSFYQTSGDGAFILVNCFHPEELVQLRYLNGKLIFPGDPDECHKAVAADTLYHSVTA